MSQENVEIVRRAFEAFNERDVDELVSLSTPDCVWLPFRAQLEGIVYRGHEGIQQFVIDVDKDWEAYQVHPVEFHHRSERVAVVAQVRALGRGGSVDVDSSAGFLIELRRARITRVTSHSNPETALEALGPPE